MGEEWALPDLSTCGNDDDLRHLSDNYLPRHHATSMANGRRGRRDVTSDPYAFSMPPMDDLDSLPPPPPLPTSEPPPPIPARKSAEQQNGGSAGGARLGPPAKVPFHIGEQPSFVPSNNSSSWTGEEPGISGAGEGLFDGTNSMLVPDVAETDDAIATPNNSAAEVDVRIVSNLGATDGTGSSDDQQRRDHEEGDGLLDVSDERHRLNTSTGSGIVSTTVPPCMSRDTIATETGTMRHIPTRSSLRHSRMLVNSTKIHPSHKTKGGFVGLMTRGAVIHDYRWGACLACVQLFLGLLQIGLACWILLLWSPSPASLHHREVPHWSGTITTLAGFIGLILMCCCPKESVFRYRASYFTKIMSVIVTTASVIACLCSAAFAAVHLGFLADMTCYEISSAILPSSNNYTSSSGDSLAIATSSRPPVPRSKIPNSSENTDLTEEHINAILASLTDPEGDDDDSDYYDDSVDGNDGDDDVLVPSVDCECRRTDGGSRRLSYAGLRCVQVRTVLRSLLIAVSVAGSAAALVSAGYLVLLWTSRYHYIPGGAYCSPSRYRTASMSSNIRSTIL